VFFNSKLYITQYDTVQNKDNVCFIYTQDNSTRARAQLYYLHSRQELDMYTFTTQDRFTLSTGTRHVQIYNSTQVDDTVHNQDNVSIIYTQPDMYTFTTRHR